MKEQEKKREIFTLRNIKHLTEDFNRKERLLVAAIEKLPL